MTLLFQKVIFMEIILLFRGVKITNYKLLCKCYNPVETLDWLLILYLRPIKKLFLMRITPGRTMGPMFFCVLEYNNGKYTVKFFNSAGFKEETLVAVFCRLFA